jgi:hypothetical protein
MGATFPDDKLGPERAVDYLLLFDNGRAAATTDCPFLADFGLLDAIFGFHAALESHRTDLCYDLLVRRACGGNRALAARTLHDIVLIGQCWGGASDD